VVWLNGDLKLQFDWDGRANGSGWHCRDCPWQRDEPLGIYNPEHIAFADMTPEALRTLTESWETRGYKCFSKSTPPLHRFKHKAHPVLHYKLGAIPYIVSSVTKAAIEYKTAALGQQDQLKLKQLADLSLKMTDAIEVQNELDKYFATVGTLAIAAQAELKKLEEEKSAATATNKSNFNRDISLCSSKIRRLGFDMTKYEQDKKVAEDKIEAIHSEINDHKATMSSDAVDVVLWIQKIQTEAMDAVGAKPQAYFGGHALIGNDCTRICQGYEEYIRIIKAGIDEALEEREEQKKAMTEFLKDIQKLLEVFDIFFSIVCSPRRISPSECDILDQCLKILIPTWEKVYKDTIGSSIPPKIHQMFVHLVPFIRKWGFAALLGEENAEHDHHTDKMDCRVTCGISNNFKQQQNANYKRRLLRYLPQQQNEFAKAIGNTSRGAKRALQQVREEKVIVKKEKREDILTKYSDVNSAQATDNMMTTTTN
jgi:hypothetical protein